MNIQIPLKLIVHYYFFIEIKNHIAETKIIKGIKLIKIKFGIYDKVKINGNNKLSLEFLKIQFLQKDLKLNLNKKILKSCLTKF